MDTTYLVLTQTLCQINLQRDPTCSSFFWVDFGGRENQIGKKTKTFLQKRNFPGPFDKSVCVLLGQNSPTKNIKV